METTQQVKAVAAAAAVAWRPDQRLKVSDWSDQYRMLSQRASAEPGPWRTERTPYLREIMDELGPDSRAREVCIMAGAQLGKTEAGNNFVGFVMDAAPGPLLVVQPTVDLAKRWSRQRLAPLIQETPRLRGKVKSPKSRDGGNTLLSKEFSGGLLMIAGANSAAGLRSMPIRYLFMDEIDAYPLDVDGEGDPVELAKARTRTFARRKIIYTSTPTIEGRSKIKQIFDRSDQRRYFVPCLGCGVMDHIRWPQIRWEPGKPDTAQYVCESCGHAHDEYQKTEMLAAGEWMATAETTDPKLVGFHINSLYSPVGWFSWADAAAKWLQAGDNHEKRKDFINTVLGETWQELGDAPDWQRLYERRESYRIGTAPGAVKFLTAGADVQKDRIEVEIVGWLPRLESYSVDYVVLPGSTEAHDAGAWVKLTELLRQTWKHGERGELGLRMLAVDTGYNTNVVYSWLRANASAPVMGVKGSDSMTAILGQPKAQDVSYQGKRIARGVQVWPVGVGTAKSELYGWLGQAGITDEETGLMPSGFCHFPQYGEEYFQQLTAEIRRVKIVRGYPRPYWEKTRDRNEALDCRVYARAAAAQLGADRLTPEQWAEISPYAQTAAPAKKPARRRGGNYYEKSW